MITNSVSLPGDPRAIELLRALKGAPLSCLHALRIAHPKPLDKKQLQFMTDYEKDAVQKAMDLLVNLYGFAAHVSRYGGWILTQLGAQLRLPGLHPLPNAETPRALGEGDFSALDGSSSSSFINSTDSILLNTPTTPPGRESDFSALAPKPEPLPENLAELFDGLLLGCAHNIAETAMRTALAGEWSAKQVECELTLWVLYCESPLGRGIDLPPARFAAAKIKKLEKAPDYFHRINRSDKQQGNAWSQWEESNRDRIRHAKKLLTEVYDYSFSPLSSW